MKALAALLLVIIVLLGVSLLRDSPSQGTAERQTWVPQNDLDPGSLLDRIDQLERRLDERAVELAPVRERTSAESDLSSLEARLDSLEERMGAVLRAFEAAGPTGASGARTSAEIMAMQMGASTASEASAKRSTKEELNRVILDPAATEGEKRDAHRALRRTEDAYTPGAVDQLLYLAIYSQDADVRADTWTSFDGKTHLPQIVPSLVQAAVSDSNSAVRIEAVETLGNYLDDPANRTLLESLAKDDPVGGVRERAVRTLKSNPGGPR